MSTPIFIEGVSFVPASFAGRSVGYTPDYITKLAREEKVLATRVSNRWYVNLDSVEAFKKVSEEEKAKRAEMIRRERLLEQEKFQKENGALSRGTTLNASTKFLEEKNFGEGVSSSRTRTDHEERHVLVALTHTLTIMLLGLMVGLGGYAVMQTTIPAQNASLWSAIEGIALSLYNTVTPEDEVIVTIPEPEIITTHTALIVAPDEIMTDTAIEEIRDSFSDDVSISMDPENPDTGMIIPHFRDRNGEAYRFLVAPVNPNTGS